MTEQQTSFKHNISFNDHVESIVGEAAEMWPELTSYSQVLANIIAEWYRMRDQDDGIQQMQDAIDDLRRKSAEVERRVAELEKSIGLPK